MARPKKQSSENENVASKIKKTEATKQCPYCKSDKIIFIKKTDIGGLYKCGCGNRCQL